MQRIFKNIFFVAVLFTLLFAVTAVSAADVSNDTTSLDDSASNINIDKAVANDNSVTNTIVKDSKNIKTTYQDHPVNDADFDNLFDDDGKLSSSVNDGDTITLTSDVTRSDKSYIINKAVNLTSTNNYTINLNTINGYNLPTTNPTAFNFVAGAANSNVTNIHFHNTQVYINTTSNIVFDHINVTNVNQGVGKSVGVFSIRDGSTNITVKNSYFLTKDNTGCSNLVLAYANDCTIENNTIIGIGQVGNLLYTTTYNTAGVNYMDTSVNRNNYFHNNRIYAYNITGGVCIAVVVSGHSNTYEGNNVSSTSAFSGQWVSPTATYVGDFSEAYEGNIYLNNDIYGSFTGTKNSTIIGNTFHGSVSLPERCIFKNNNVENSTVNVNGANCDLCGNTINTLNVASAATNTRVCWDNNINTIIDPYFKVIRYLHPLSLNFNKEKNLSVKGDGESVIIDVTEENFNTYFTSRYNGQDDSYNFNPTSNMTINLFYVPPTTKYLHFDFAGRGPYECSVIGKNNLTLKNVQFYAQNFFLTISDINLVYDEEFNKGSMVVVSNYNLGSSTQHVTLNNITFNAKVEYSETMFPLIVVTKQQGKHSVIKNSHFNVIAPSIEGTYVPIQVRESNTQFINNTITIQECYSVGDNPSLTAIGFNEAYASTEDILEYNNITLTGSEDGGALYAIKMNTNGTQIKNNNITITSKTTAPAIELNGNTNTVTDNYIATTYKSGNDAVTVTGENNVVENNIGPEIDTRIATSIELDNNNNPIDVGQRLIISGVFKADNVESEASGIKVYDNDELIATINSDEFGTVTYAYTPTVSGSHNINFEFEGNDTHQNTSTIITVEVNEVVEPAKETQIVLQVQGSSTMNVSEQKYISGYFALKGSYTGTYVDLITIYDNGEQIATVGPTNDWGTISLRYNATAPGEHNITFKYAGNDSYLATESSVILTVQEPPKEYSLKVDTMEFTTESKATITASIYYGNEYGEDVASDINKGKVTFKVNGKTLKDENGKVIYAKVVNGTASIENYNIPEDWKENSTIQAVYSGSNEVSKLTSEKQNITITQEELTLTTEDKTAAANSTITLTATLSDNTINTGKIVFKVNGKTVKDANGKVIYAKVVNGTVSLEYTIPGNLKAGNYTITAVYTSTNYPKLEDTKTLTIA